MPWARASAQVIVPLPLLAYRVSAYASGVGVGGFRDLLLPVVKPGVLHPSGLSQCGSGLLYQLLERLKALVRPG